MSCPHGFDSVHQGTTFPVLLIGAGMSMPALGTEEIMGRLREGAGSATCQEANANKCLGTESEVCFYCLADWWLDRIADAKEHRRFVLAEKMGLFGDPRFLGRTDLPLGRNYQRHRAIARLAADGRLKAVVSLNWDLFLEAAFEAAGFHSCDPADQRPGLHVGGYVSIISNNQQALASNSRLFKIIKPHGCCADLEICRKTSPAQEPILKATYRDLNDLRAQLKNGANGDVTWEIKSELKGCTLIAAGWGASEPYLLDLIDELSEDIPKSKSDRLAIIALKDRWTSGHERIAATYGAAKDESFFGVENYKDTDQLFLWIYSRWAIKNLASSIRYLAEPVADALDIWASTMINPGLVPSWCYAFFDDFLPAWTRVCWRMGGVQYFLSTGHLLPAHQIPLAPRDWYVPFETHGAASPADSRPDLASAARLLSALKDRKKGSGCNVFPGALWDENKGTLLIPVPLFIPETDPLDTIGSLGALVNQWQREHAPLQRVKQWRLLPIGKDGDHTNYDPDTVQMTIRRLVTGVARYFNDSALAQDNPTRYQPAGFTDL